MGKVQLIQGEVIDLIFLFGLFSVKHTKDNPRKSEDLFPVGSF